MRGQAEEGITQMTQGMAAFRATGAGLARPYFLAMLAEALAVVEKMTNAGGRQSHIDSRANSCYCSL
jgi:predicted ATPase